MTIPLKSMYLLGVAIGLASFLVSRGPDGHLTGFFIAFSAIAVTYWVLAWMTRHQAMWSHIGAHLMLFGVAVVMGMLPKPHLEEMAAMLYLFAPVAIIAMVIVACLIRLLGRG